MVIPIEVSSDTPPNAPNQQIFINKVDKTERRVTSLERGSIRSGSVGGAGLKFYDPDEEDARTAQIGEFDGYYWNQTAAEWQEIDGIRGVALYEADSSVVYPWFVAGSDANIQFFQVGYGGTPVEIVLLKAKDIWLQSETNADIHLSDDGDITISPASGHFLQLLNIPTVGAGDHLVFDIVGGKPIVKYIVSALKYKEAVEDAEIDPTDVLQMQGRTWRDKNEDPESDRRHIGFIADELADLPTLRQFVNFKDGEPESIHYDRLTVALLELLKSQQNQIDSINEKLAQL